MLLPRAKRIEVRLGADAVELAVWHGWRKPRLAQQAVYQDPAGRYMSLLAASDQLARALDHMAEEVDHLRGAWLNAVVGDEWLVYEIVDVDLRELSARAASAVVAALVADAAGVEPALLVVRWQTIEPDTRQLVCAVPAAALVSLEQTVQRHNLRWESLQGEFVTSFNRHRNRLGGSAAALAVMRPQGTQIGVFAGGALKALHHEAGRPAPARLKSLSESLLRRRGCEPDSSMLYIGDATDGVLETPWLASTPAQ